MTASLHSLIVNDGLVGYWKLDEGAGTSAEDSSGYGHEGTLVNDPVRSTDTPPTVFSDMHALLFDGADDYVSIADNSRLTPSALTVAAWIRRPPGARVLARHDRRQGRLA